MAIFTSPIARGSNITEVVTRIDNANCKLVEHLEESGDDTYACRGYGEVTVTKLLGHDLMTLSYGPDAQNSCAWDQGFISPSGAKDELSWRVVNGRAFAVIERWSVGKYDQARGDYDITEWIAVTQLRPQQICHVAYIRADQPDSLGVARKIADRYATTPFDCAVMKPDIQPSMDDDPDFEGFRLDCNH
ncbi:MAG: hypothetical protein JNJ53_01565 [Rhizobiales bacterium]|nr:hypothetical protein [Hyphomicrobiales bacterium]